MTTRFFYIFNALVLTLHTIQGYSQENTRVETYKFYSDRSIYHHPTMKDYLFFKIDAGDFVVFEFYSNNSGESGNNSVADARLVFQIEKGLDKFSIEGGDISEKNVGRYVQQCKCMDKGVQNISSGLISGEKLTDEIWLVSVDVKIIGWQSGKEYNFAFKREFNYSK